MIDVTADKFIASVRDEHSIELQCVEMGMKQAKKIVIDLGLVIECKESNLLPERLLGAWRICRPDLTRTVDIDQMFITIEFFVKTNIFY